MKPVPWLMNHLRIACVEGPRGAPQGQAGSPARRLCRARAVYFGYTYCPDICPTDLLQIGLAVDKLGPAGNDVQPLFISVDPGRDTIEVLARYVAMFHPAPDRAYRNGRAGPSRRGFSYKAYYAKYPAARRVACI